MANDHPFHNLFETLGRVPGAHAEPVNRQASQILADILTVPLEKAGRCILLRAPRAGHGKTHLLSRIQHKLGSSHEFIPLHAAFGCKIDATTVTEDTLRRLVRQLPASGGLTVLDLVARRLFSSALQPLVNSGEVPSEDREGALASLRNRPVETFDFHHPNAVTAHWAKKNFEILSQRLSYELAQQSGIAVRGIDFWIGVLFRYSSSALDNPNRLRLLADSVHSSTGLEMERLEALLGLLALQVRVVLVADDLEGFSADETAALRFAAFVGSLRQSVERLDVILSLNQDIWQSAFIPRLSDGLADRLSEVVVELEPLKEAEMAALLDSRAPGLGKQILGRIDLGKSGTHARGLIREAGLAWLKATATDSAPVSPVVPAQTPPPLMGSPISPTAPEPPPLIPVLAPVFEPAPEPKTAVFHGPPPLPPAEEVIAPVASVGPIFNNATSEREQTTAPEPVLSPTARKSSVFASEPAQRAPVFQATPVEVTPPVYIPEPVAAAFFQAPKPVFQTAPAEISPESAADSAPPLSQLPEDSPFKMTPPEQTITATSDPVSQPAASPVSQPAPANPPSTGADTDRVDDLLRQFRERYGRGSL